MPTQNQQYETVAASQTDQVLGVTGGKGDYISHLVIVPETTASGAVTLTDGATPIVLFLGGGTTALLTLAPLVVPLNTYSASGSWKITTGANVHVIAVGSFSL